MPIKAYGPSSRISRNPTLPRQGGQLEFGEPARIKLMNFIKQERFFEGRVLARTMPPGSLKNTVFSIIAQGFVTQNLLVECAATIVEVPDLTVKSSIICTVSELLALQNRLDKANQFINVLPDSEKSNALRTISLLLVNQKRFDEAYEIAKTIPERLVRNAVIMDIFKAQYSLTQLVIYGCNGLSKCCSWLGHTVFGARG